jgi:hypothetical protein
MNKKLEVPLLIYVAPDGTICCPKSGPDLSNLRLAG